MKYVHEASQPHYLAEREQGREYTLKLVINRGCALLSIPSSEDQVSPLQQE